MRLTVIRALFLSALLIAFAAAPAAQAEAAGPDLRGVQLHSLWGDVSYADMDRELDVSREAGANVVRVDVGWSSLETGGKGQISTWYRDKLDHFVNGANARGIKVIAGLWSTPCWASSAPESKKQGCAGTWWDRGVTMYPPNNNADFADISRWITNRYGTKLAALEVWNEPNLPEDRFWIANDEPAAYAGLLKAAYPAAKQGNADVPVLAGSLASADRPFLEQLYAHGIKGSFDGISIHPYNEWRDPADRWQDQFKKYTFLPGIEWIKQAQQAAGDNTPLWLTEFGWTSCSGGGWCVNEAKQAEYTAKAFDLLKSMNGIKAAVTYNLREKGTDSASFEDNFGLVNKDFSPKPAFNALKQALTSQTPVPPLPPVPPVNPPPVDLPQVKLPVVPPVGPAGSVPPLTTKPAATRPRPAKRPGRRPAAGRKVLTLRIARRAGRVFAIGSAPRGARLSLRLTGCAYRSAARTLRLKAGRRGRFYLRLGSAKRFRGCRLTLKVAGRRMVAHASIS